MEITRAVLKNFGAFSGKEAVFSPGLNVVYGENGSGKSTLQRFLTGMLFGVEKPRGRAQKNNEYLRNEPWELPACYGGLLEISLGGKGFALERSFYHKEKSASLRSMEDGEELSVEHGDLEMLLGGISRSCYENTFCIPQAAVQPGSDFGSELKNYLVNTSAGGEAGVDIIQAFRSLEDKKKRAQARKKELELAREQELDRLRLKYELLSEETRRIQEEAEEGEPEEPVHYQEPEPLPAVPSRRQSRSGWLIPAAGLILLLWRLGLRSMVPGGLSLPALILEGLLWIGLILYTGIWLGGRGNGKREGALPEAVLSAPVQGPGQALAERVLDRQIRLDHLREAMEEAGRQTAEERQAQEEIQAAGLAAQVLEQVQAQIQTNGRERLLSCISEIFNGITGHAGERVGLTEQMELTLHNGTRILSPWQLSRGTMEQLYLSVRLGAGRSLLQEEPMPILLDETFCSYDDSRLDLALQWLAKQPEQVILFTCQKRELLALERCNLVCRTILL